MHGATIKKKDVLFFSSVNKMLKNKTRNKFRIVRGRGLNNLCPTVTCTIPKLLNVTKEKPQAPRTGRNCSLMVKVAYLFTTLTPCTCSEEFLSVFGPFSSKLVRNTKLCAQSKCYLRSPLAKMNSFAFLSID